MKHRATFWDPIAAEQARQDREEDFARLFSPILLTPETPDRWIVKGLLPYSYLTVVASEPKIGKTSFITALALAVATGTPFAGLATSQSPVLWISGEENSSERNHLLAKSPLADPAVPFYTCHQPILIDTQEGIEALDFWLRETRAGLIVVDPLVACSSGRALVDSHTARKTLTPLKNLCSRHGVSAIVTHHSARRNRISNRGVADSAQLAATASQTWLFDRSASPDPEMNSIVHVRSRGRGDFANRYWTFASNGPVDYRSLEAKNEPNPPEKPLGLPEQQVLEALADGPKTSDKILDCTHGAPSTLRNAITNLRRLGKIVVEVREDGHRQYRLVPE